MFYIGNMSDEKVQNRVAPQFEDFETTYPHIDFFFVDHYDIDRVSEKIENLHIIIYFGDQPPDSGLGVFFKLFTTHSNKKFIILTHHPGWAEVAPWPDNVEWVFYHCIPFSSEPVEQEYRTMDCLVDKNFDSTKIGISLNRLPRKHRLCGLSYMLGAGLDETCVITAPLLAWHLQNEQRMDLMNTIPWDFSKHDYFKHTMLHGWERAKNADGIFTVPLDAYPPYDDFGPNQRTSCNFDNYKNRLQPLYKNSFVEFVNSSVYEYRLPWVCEKPLNSQLGCNFPIFVAGRGTVQWFRNNGLDVFDDIVDHSYDLEEDPVLRLEKLVCGNQHLLSNMNKTKDLWTKHHNRFKSNVRAYWEIGDRTAIAGFDALKEWISNNG